MDLPQSDSGLLSLGFVYLHASSFPFLMVNIFINKSALSGILIMTLKLSGTHSWVERLDFKIREPAPSSSRAPSASLACHLSPFSLFPCL